MASRSKRAEIARETITILEQGFYQNNQGKRVSIKESLDFAKSNSLLYAPDSFKSLFEERDEKLKETTHCGTVFEVENETTFHAAKRLHDTGSANPLCLNFASAKNPGGGFLNGSQAQEESLSRASGLYPCIAQMQEMYDTNRKYNSCLYTDYMIYSPRVPVFRDDDDRLLDAPYEVSIITAPAVNVGALRQNKSSDIDKVQEVMLVRTEKVLSVAVVNNHDTLILGAWGCGVFQNAPDEVAGYFHKHLIENPTFKGVFKRVVFAVFDKDEKNIKPFRDTFSQKSLLD